MNHSLDNKNIGIGITGSYCTYKKVFNELKRLSEANTNLYTIFQITLLKLTVDLETIKNF